MLLLQGWAALLVELFTCTAAAGDSSSMAALLQLLLNLAAASEHEQAAAAAAAVRAVCSAAFKAGWVELHQFAPLLMQVSRTCSTYMCYVTHAKPLIHLLCGHCAPEMMHRRVLLSWCQ